MQQPSPGRYPNLPQGQRFTQWLVDAFNSHESLWRRLRERIDRRRADRREGLRREDSEKEETGE